MKFAIVCIVLVSVTLVVSDTQALEQGDRGVGKGGNRVETWDRGKLIQDEGERGQLVGNFGTGQLGNCELAGRNTGQEQGGNWNSGQGGNRGQQGGNRGGNSGGNRGGTALLILHLPISNQQFYAVRPTV
ncbi:hypothetical protein Ocin01_18951 [Orchesella cincta]|uniref:Uncharacterized protein n=1 Tax=Orchesella cincta TaxID=48709 RepID=A0A1D2M497_ORCCI|nr:hypothetical protein Ocin01_18951 [Orchesella cincta]